MNIGLFTDTYFPQISGVSTSISILKDELEQLGHHVIIFTTTDPNAKAEANIIRLPSIPFASFEDRRIAYSGFDRCLRIAKAYKLELVHTHTEFSLGLAGRYVASRMHIPSVHTYHTMYENYTHYLWNGQLIQPHHVRVFSRLYCSQTDGVVVPSQMTYDTLRNYGVKVPIRIIPTGVRIPEYNEGTRYLMREQLNLKEDDIVLLSLSRLSKEKRIDEIIKAFPKVKTTFPRAKLVVVGEGPARESLESLAQSLNIDTIYFTGEVQHKDVASYYQMSDVYVNASDSESQGLTYLEAIVNRLPVIARHNDYLEGLIQEERQMGVLYNQEDDLSNVIIDFLKQKQHNQSSQIDEAMLYPFSSGYFGKQVEQFYNDVINDPNSIKTSMFERVSTGVKELIREIVVGGDSND